MVPLLGSEAKQQEAGQDAGGERDAEVDAHALCDLADAHVHRGAVQTEQARKHGDEHIRIHGIEQHLEYRVEGHQPRRVLAVTLGQFVPDDDHGDAAGQTDHDHALHKCRLIGKQEDREEEHEDGAHYPVLHE